MKVQIYNYRHEDAVNIRQEVFMQEQGFPYEYDEIDDFASHIVIYDDGPVGVCRIFPDQNNDLEFIIGRLAVVKEQRKRGIGRNLLAACEEYAREHGGAMVKLHSQCQASDFYEKCGYVAKGEVEDEEGVPHIWMYKFLDSENEV